jgi:hypothetical protein
VRVAWIGNSYTYVNDLPTMLRSVAASAGIATEHSQVTPGGTSLFGHANLSTALGKATLAMLTNESGYNFVVMQDQSETAGGARDTDAGLPVGAALALSTKAMGSFYRKFIPSASQPVPTLYSTWGRRDPKTEDPKNGDIYTDFQTMNDLTTGGYVAYAAALDLPNTRIAPCGRAFEIVYNETSDPLAADSRFFLLYASGGMGVGGHPSVSVHCGQ